MRVPFIRRAAIAASIIAIAVAPLAACSDDDDSSSDTSTTTSAEATSSAAETSAAAAGAADEATTKAITDAYTVVFNGSAPAAERAALVENGATFLPVLEGAASNPQSQGTTATVTAVTLTDANNANVTWTLNVGGAPVLPDQTGQAINDAGTWKVSASTLCALLAIAGGGGPVPGC